jgi:hypothetical protein
MGGGDGQKGFGFLAVRFCASEERLRAGPMWAVHGWPKLCPAQNI